MTRSHRVSGFVKSLGRYGKPRPGERLEIKYGRASVPRLIPYDEAIAEMKRDGVPSGEIERFNMRVEHFLRNRAKYFECELAYPKGENERIDWSEYLALKNREKR